MFLLGKDKPEPETYALIKASNSLIFFKVIKASKMFSHLVDTKTLSR